MADDGDGRLRTEQGAGGGAGSRGRRGIGSFNLYNSPTVVQIFPGTPTQEDTAVEQTKSILFFLFPEGPYGIFAGRDASRGLATFCLDKDALRDEYDDLSDLNAVQMESVREWEMQFKEKYDYVGRLLKPGEEPSEYTDEEDTKDHTKQD
nr:membrane-associated progesterone receptor component 2 [Pogona vitticeps]